MSWRHWLFLRFFLEACLICKRCARPDKKTLLKMSRPIQTGKEARGGLAQRVEVSEVGLHEQPGLKELWTIDYTLRNSSLFFGGGTNGLRCAN